MFKSQLLLPPGNQKRRLFTQWKFYVLLLFLAVQLSAGAQTGGNPGQAYNAIILYNGNGLSDFMNEDNQTIIDNVKAFGCNTIFYHLKTLKNSQIATPSNLGLDLTKDYLDKVVDFVDKCSNQDIKVFALTLDSAEYIFDSTAALHKLSRVLYYQKMVRNTSEHPEYYSKKAHFQGIVTNLEPWTVAQWGGNMCSTTVLDANNTIVGNYLDLIPRLHRHIVMESFYNPPVFPGYFLQPIDGKFMGTVHWNWHYFSLKESTNFPNGNFNQFVGVRNGKHYFDIILPETYCAQTATTCNNNECVDTSVDYLCPSGSAYTNQESVGRCADWFDKHYISSTILPTMGTDPINAAPMLYGHSAYMFDEIDQLMATRESSQGISLGNSNYKGSFIYDYAQAKAQNKRLKLNVLIEGLFSPDSIQIGYYMNRAMAGEVGRFADEQVADRITVELHSTAGYDTIVFSDTTLLYRNTQAELVIPGSIVGNYYVTIKHRNSIETVSSCPVEFAYGTDSHWDFTNAKKQAYGNNLTKMLNHDIYAIFTGDVDQDGAIGVSDMGLIDNQSSNFATGYLPEDLNGDGSVGIDDMGICSNNIGSFITRIIPVAGSSNHYIELGCSYVEYKPTEVSPGVFGYYRINSTADLVMPGDTIDIAAGRRNTYLRIKGLKGTDEQRIVLRNEACGVVTIYNPDAGGSMSLKDCKNIRLTGTGNPDATYGIRLGAEPTKASTVLSFDEFSTDFECDHVEVYLSGFAGIACKTDPDFLSGSCDQENPGFVMNNVRLHHNYIHNTMGEGFYIGYSEFGPQLEECSSNYSDTLTAHEIKHIRVHNNIIDNTGYDGLQISCCTEDVEVYDNTITRYGHMEQYAGLGAQGIVIGGGSTGKYYNNYIADGFGTGIMHFGLGGTHIYNNIIVKPGHTCTFSVLEWPFIYGIYCDSRTTIPGNSIFVINNTIVGPRTGGIELIDTISKKNRVYNNTILYPKISRSLGGGWQKSIVHSYENSILSNNYGDTTFYKSYYYPGMTGTDLDPYFEDAANGNFRLKNGSPLLDGGIAADTVSSFTKDFEGQNRPMGNSWDVGADESPSDPPQPNIALKLYLEGLYNSNGYMRMAQDELGNHFPDSVADIITVELHDSADYSTVVYLVDSVSLLTNGSAEVYIPLTFNQSYYITIRHRNSLETTTASTVNFENRFFTYNFSQNASQAYGSNQIELEDGIYGIYGGDPNQDGLIDGDDLTFMEPDLINGNTGYIATDLNGNGFVDGDDLNFIDPKVLLGIAKQTP